MTRRQTIDLMGQIKSNYPKFMVGKSARDKQNAVDNYFAVLKDYDYIDRQLLLGEYIRRGKSYYPMPLDFGKLYGEILEACTNWYWQPKNSATWELSKVKQTWENDRILKVVADYDNYIAAELKRLQRQN